MRIKSLLSLSCAIFIINVAHAQPDSLWSRTYGGDSSDVCNYILPLIGGGYILDGHTRSFGSGKADVWVLRTDMNGDTLWSRTYGGNGDDYGFQCVPMQAGGFALCCATESFGSGGFDAWLLRITDNGDSLWSRTFGGAGTDLCGNILQTDSGGFILAGYTDSFGAGLNDMWLVRADANGDSLWSRTFGGAGQDQCFSMIADEAGGVILAGGTTSFGAGRNDMWMLAVSADGDSIWSRTYGTANRNERANCLVRTWDGAYALSGYRVNAAGYFDCLIVRFASNRDRIWETTFPNRQNGYYRSLIETRDSALVVTGWTGNFEDVWLAKISDSGDSLWSCTFGGDSSDVAMSVAQISDGGFVLAAQTKSFGARNWDFWIVGTGPDPLIVHGESLIMIPSLVTLNHPFPNPFNSVTNIAYGLPSAGRVKLAIYDLTGREVIRLVDQEQQSGYHNTLWRGNDATGIPVSTGIYLCRLETESFTKSMPMTLLK